MMTLMSKCLLLRNAFKMDVEVIDEQLNTVLHISEDPQPTRFIHERKKLHNGFQQAFLHEKTKHSFCLQTDALHLSYLATSLVDFVDQDQQKKIIIVIGPFMNQPLSDTLIWNVMKRNLLGNNWFEPLKTYYKTIPFVGESYLAVGDLLVNICAHPLVETQIIALQSNDATYELFPQHHSELDDKDIKLRYAVEEELMHYIEIGDKEKALHSFVAFNGDFNYRVPGNPLRARKNLSFVYNALSRVAARKGGVEPQYLHVLSEKFAYKIEAAITIAELHALEVSMTEEYCNLVVNAAVKGHSIVVQKALSYIHLHFDQPISLQTVADEIEFNRTYLAKRFKEEVSLSVVDYINKKRTEEAVFLIKQGRYSLSDIGLLVGFGSYNYFSKVFKEITGVTATAYKNNMGT